MSGEAAGAASLASLANKAFSGGEKLEARLRELSKKIGKKASLNVGFLEGATYPDGKLVAYIASILEFGGTWTVPARTATIYRLVNDARTGYLRNGRFVKKSASNFETTHDVEAHSFTIPPRPFFRSMIKGKSPEWGDALANELKAQDYDVSRALDRLGEGIAGQLRQSIRDTDTPPNAPSTIAKKGFATPLIDTGDMLKSVDHEVTE
jgi:hypothetical protein